MRNLEDFMLCYYCYYFKIRDICSLNLSNFLMLYFLCVTSLSAALICRKMAHVELTGYKNGSLQISVVKIHERYQSLKKKRSAKNVICHFTPTKDEFQQYYSIPFSVFFVEVGHRREAVNSLMTACNSELGQRFQ